RWAARPSPATTAAAPPPFRWNDRLLAAAREPAVEESAVRAAAAAGVDAVRVGEARIARLAEVARAHRLGRRPVEAVPGGIAVRLSHAVGHEAEVPLARDELSAVGEIAVVADAPQGSRRAPAVLRAA